VIKLRRVKGTLESASRTITNCLRGAVVCPRQKCGADFIADQMQLPRAGETSRKCLYVSAERVWNPLCNYLTSSCEPGHPCREMYNLVILPSYKLCQTTGDKLTMDEDFEDLLAGWQRVRTV
jgi:hypothetical protein